MATVKDAIATMAKNIESTTGKPVARWVALARANNTQLIVVVPPFHPLYVQNRIGFGAYVQQVQTELSRFNVPVLDHSAGIVNSYDSYADLIHMNLDGQKIYSQYFAERVIP